MDLDRSLFDCFSITVQSGVAPVASLGAVQRLLDSRHLGHTGSRLESCIQKNCTGARGPDAELLDFTFELALMRAV